MCLISLELNAVLGELGGKNERGNVENDAKKQLIVDRGLILAWLAFSAMLGLLIARAMGALPECKV